MTIKKVIYIISSVAISFAVIAFSLVFVKFAHSGSVPIPGSGGDTIGFGGIVVGVLPCECPVVGMVLTVVGAAGGGSSGGTVKLFLGPGSIRVFPFGQHLRPSPFVIGKAETTRISCGEIDDGCDIFDGGLKLRSIGSFKP